MPTTKGVIIQYSAAFCNSVLIRYKYLRYKNQQDALFYSKFISIINLYMFRAGLLPIIMRYFSVYTAIDLGFDENNQIV